MMCHSIGFLIVSLYKLQTLRVGILQLELGSSCHACDAQPVLRPDQAVPDFNAFIVHS